MPPSNLPRPLRGRGQGEGVTLERAKNLRKNTTDAEQKLWLHLRSRSLSGYKFRRQHPIGPFITDFCCVAKRLIIELDGGQHKENAAYDERRTRFLETQGYRVIRFWDDEVFRNPEGMLEFILEKLEEAPLTLPSPRKRGEG